MKKERCIKRNHYGIAGFDAYCSSTNPNIMIFEHNMMALKSMFSIGDAPLDIISDKLIFIHEYQQQYRYMCNQYPEWKFIFAVSFPSFLIVARDVQSVSLFNGITNTTNNRVWHGFSLDHDGEDISDIICSKNLY